MEGADLCIKEVHQPIMDKYWPLFEEAVKKRDSFRRGSKEAQAAQQEVSKYYDLMYSEGYFRDHHNCCSLLWALGLSWWRDVIPLYSDKEELEGESLRKFRGMVATAGQGLPTRKELETNGAVVEDDGENSLEGWHKYYLVKRAQLLAFLDQAIELNTAVRCSL